MERYKIKHKVTTPYHPQDNGKVEGKNKFLRLSSPRLSDYTSRTGMTDSLKLYGPTRKHGGLLLVAPHMNWCMEREYYFRLKQRSKHLEQLYNLEWTYLKLRKETPPDQ
jgi:transposase InsO family protein